MLEQIQNSMQHLPDWAWNLLLVSISIILGFFVKLILALLLRYTAVKPGKDYSIPQSIFSNIGKPVNYFLPILVFNFLLPLMRVKPTFADVLDKTVSIFLTISFAAVLIGLVNVLRDYIYHSFDISKADNLRERKIRTQVQFIWKLVVGLIIIVTICAILLSFDGLRRIGAGLLTGVGVGGIIIGFAAQKSLANILAGFQIAFTQPIRIDDVLIVENEWGRVEEITLTYVVMNLWDKRRLVLPINYFIEKPFQNWTRNTADLLGYVYLYVDYTMPIEPLRTELKRLLELTPLWDKKVSVLQVTNTTEKIIELRALMSARNSGEAFDLRCYIRENMVNFIQKNYPGSLPKTRLEGIE